MGDYILLNINLDKKIHKQLHKLMDTEIEDEDGNIRFQMHKGSKQQFYREVMEEGLNVKYAKLDKKKKELKNADKDNSA